MTRQQCKEILSNPEHPDYKLLHHTFYTNMNLARKHFRELGTYTKGMVLHHKFPGCTNYEEWKIDELIPMKNEDHSSFHHTRKPVSDETRERNRQACLKTRNFDSANRGKIRDLNLAQWANPEIHERRRAAVASKIGHKIQCVETGQIFDSVHNAEVTFKLCHIKRALIDPWRIVGGYHWRYV